MRVEMKSQGTKLKLETIIENTKNLAETLTRILLSL